MDFGGEKNSRLLEFLGVMWESKYQPKIFATSIEIEIRNRIKAIRLKLKFDILSCLHRLHRVF